MCAAPVPRMSCQWWGAENQHFDPVDRFSPYHDEAVRTFYRVQTR
jgi:hypothetical protein